MEIQKLLANGDGEAVKQYTQILQDLINGDTTVKEALSAVKDAAGKGNLLSAFNSVIGAATAEGATAASFVEATKKAGTDAYTSVAEQATDVVNAATEAVENAAQDLQNQAQDAVQKKVDEGKAKANEAINNTQQRAAEAVNGAAQRGADAARKALGL